MYSLLVSPNRQHWEKGKAEVDRRRFLEQTVGSVRRRFRDSQSARPVNLEQLERVPALLGYEIGKGDLFRLAWLSAIEVTPTSISFGIAYDPNWDPVPTSFLQQYRDELSINVMELHSHHWAVKDDDLLNFLRTHGFAKEAPQGVGGVKPGSSAASTNARPSPSQTSAAAIEAATDLTSKPRVFVVHGRDEGMKNTVSRFLERIGLEAVILHEQPNAGRTVISKFIETGKTCQFAVALLAPEDLGELRGAGAAPKFRARQNVVFELGFFIGVLGPANVVALIDGDVERPSDLDGVVYVSYKGSWKQELARELHQAGIVFDHKIALLQT